MGVLGFGLGIGFCVAGGKLKRVIQDGAGPCNLPSEGEDKIR